ncbi:MAG: hypothetical protein EP343_10905 [Deltaproteobacteria bacterium]|nr:MAG: hypothetical protein EP343_10905 [Deltaproteobacteria bacterium]
MWTYFKSIGLVAAVVVGMSASTVWAEPPVDLAKWKSLIKKGQALRNSHKKAEQLRRAELLWKAYLMNPKAFRSLEVGSMACNIRARHAKNSTRIKMWAKSGIVLAKTMMKRWPKRAEGYFWSSIHWGQYARGGGVWVAMTKGIAGKVVKYAKTSLKLNRKVYRGGAQRILGRYYFRVPWPWKRKKKSLKYLQEAHRIAPKDAGGMLFLGETLYSMGQKKKAKAFFRKCSTQWTPGLRANAAPSRCRKWLKKY